MNVADPADDALDAGAIARLLPSGVSLPIEVLATVDSTNAELLRRGAGAPRALLAEQQSAGRGRRGRRWLAAGPGSLCLSLQWHSRRALGESSLLPLVAGLACAEALRGLGAPVGVKWPNDLLAGDAKLGGLLVEARGAPAGGGTAAVIGVGLNLRLPPELRAALPEDAQPVTDLAAVLPPPLPPRNAVAAALLAALVARLETFEQAGWNTLAAAWAAVDVLAGRRVRVRDARGDAWGEVLGLAGDGALRVRFADREACVHSGEVSVRP